MSSEQGLQGIEQTPPGDRVTAEEALALHARGRPGKIEVIATKPLTTARDLSLAYSPGVAAPCLAIQKDPDTAYDYTVVMAMPRVGMEASWPTVEITASSKAVASMY